MILTLASGRRIGTARINMWDRWRELSDARTLASTGTRPVEELKNNHIRPNKYGTVCPYLYPLESLWVSR